jgi:hypothetical protein
MSELMKLKEETPRKMHDMDRMIELQMQGENDEAKLLCDKMEALGPKGLLDENGNNTKQIWWKHEYNRGWFLIREGDYQKGCELLESGRWINCYGNPPLRTNAPIFKKGMDIKGKSIIISLEGGLGDEMISVRFAASYKKAGASKVYIACDPALVSLFERVEGVDRVILREEPHTVPHDYWIPGFSAGWCIGHTFEDLPSKPYLTAKPESVEIWKNAIKTDKIKVGIRWAGSPRFEHQQLRRFPENFITNLSKYSELQLYSLQRDNNLITLPDNVFDLEPLLSSVGWEDTAAVIANLDLVITSCTSVAHLAAAMGKETWVMNPVLPYHTWTYGTPDSRTTPYYENVRIFRQEKINVWNTAWQLLYKELEEKFNLTHIDLPNEDKEYKKLNMGCGWKKIDGFINADKSNLFKPDLVMDFNKVPWPFEDNEFNFIWAKDILEHLGDTSDDFIKIIKEMYRVSAPGCIWEVQSPHWRCDNAINDPEHKRLITLGMFGLFNKDRLLRTLHDNPGTSDSLLAFEHDIDIDVFDTKNIYCNYWEDLIHNKKVTEDELSYSLATLNNVAESVLYAIQVHKPGRIHFKEIEDIIIKYNEVEKIKLKDEE